MATSITKELNKYLKELTKEELEKEIRKLYSKFENVKEYYKLELGEDTSKVLGEYKRKIRGEYFSKRGMGRASSKESRKVISEFKKISIFQDDVIELLLYRVEVMQEFANEYGDAGYVSEPFCSSMTTSFQEACKLIKTEKLETKFRPIVQKMVTASAYFGWYVEEAFAHYYHVYLGEQDSSEA
ncbi:DUF6155 family protein [Hugenholtzia roseola]|uniref:DUF6155 family protein n=1 Tax=Hugenholtzia roseola TaxID=1002 RepID=UPI000478BD55|nr:DUF6155 family protein [Hugenholtzia roseola]